MSDIEQAVADRRRDVRRLVEDATAAQLAAMVAGWQAAAAAAAVAEPMRAVVEAVAARPIVSIPAHHCGPGNHGVRVGRLVEDRDGMAQVEVAGWGVLNVPSSEVER